ncbi:MAG TPA: group II intron maturase-specific domain-containing protein [Pilimelia sp.]|nr:group II intron maturase-specific domain-containing protein [Pilimelia sp.]
MTREPNAGGRKAAGNHLRGGNAAMVISHLNPILRGWAAYYRTVVSKHAFTEHPPIVIGRLAQRRSCPRAAVVADDDGPGGHRWPSPESVTITPGRTPRRTSGTCRARRARAV